MDPVIARPVYIFRFARRSWLQPPRCLCSEYYTSSRYMYLLVACVCVCISRGLKTIRGRWRFLAGRLLLVRCLSSNILDTPVFASLIVASWGPSQKHRRVSILCEVIAACRRSGPVIQTVVQRIQSTCCSSIMQRRSRPRTVVTSPRGRRGYWLNECLSDG
jgi:hypothetical protein